MPNEPDASDEVQGTETRGEAFNEVPGAMQLLERRKQAELLAFSDENAR